MPGSEHGAAVGISEAGRSKLSDLLLGRPLRTDEERAERLSNPVALAILSSDALSSVAYATEEMLKVLVPAAGIAAFSYVPPISAVIILLLLTLVFSYRQTIRAYPSAGGAYVVTRDNFGITIAQFAGVALLLDYIMTVAVSTSAGVAAIYSAMPGLFSFRVPIAVGLILLIAWVNLRGLRMSGRVFAAPTYVFVCSIIGLLVVGLVRLLTGGLHPLPVPAHLQATGGAVTLFVLMHAYATGTTALTGVEAISNGVPVFRPVEWRNARRVLTWMGAILITLFGGISYLAWRLHPIPTEKETVVSLLGRAIYGRGTLGALLDPAPPRHAVLVPVNRADITTRDALAVAHLIGGHELHVVHFDRDDEETRDLEQKWDREQFHSELEIVAAPDRILGDALGWELDDLRRHGVRLVAVVIPELIPRWWQQPLYSRDTKHLLRVLRHEHDVAITTVPHPL